MPRILCDRTSFKILEVLISPVGIGTDEISFFVAEDIPDLDAVRWNGDTETPALRVATAQEMVDDTTNTKTNQAMGELNTPLNKTLRDVLWDLEERARAAGQPSSIAEIAAVSDGNRSGYTQELRKIHEGYQ